MQQLSDTVHATVAQQRAAYDRIDGAARALAAASSASRDAASGIDDVAQALRERVASIASGPAFPANGDIARLTGSR
jgi:hypothetical protein